MYRMRACAGVRGSASARTAARRLLRPLPAPPLQAAAAHGASLSSIWTYHPSASFATRRRLTADEAADARSGPVFTGDTAEARMGREREESRNPLEPEGADTASIPQAGAVPATATIIATPAPVEGGSSISREARAAVTAKIAYRRGVGPTSGVSSYTYGSPYRSTAGVGGPGASAATYTGADSIAAAGGVAHGSSDLGVIAQLNARVEQQMAGHEDIGGSLLGSVAGSQTTGLGSTAPRERAYPSAPAPTAATGTGTARAGGSSGSARGYHTTAAAAALHDRVKGSHIFRPEAYELPLWLRLASNGPISRDELHPQPGDDPLLRAALARELGEDAPDPADAVRQYEENEGGQSYQQQRVQEHDAMLQAAARAHHMPGEQPPDATTQAVITDAELLPGVHGDEQARLRRTPAYVAADVQQDPCPALPDGQPQHLRLDDSSPEAMWTQLARLGALREGQGVRTLFTRTQAPAALGSGRSGSNSGSGRALHTSSLTSFYRAAKPATIPQPGDQVKAMGALSPDAKAAAAAAAASPCPAPAAAELVAEAVAVGAMGAAGEAPPESAVDPVHGGSGSGYGAGRQMPPPPRASCPTTSSGAARRQEEVEEASKIASDADRVTAAFTNPATDTGGRSADDTLKGRVGAGQPASGGAATIGQAPRRRYHNSITSWAAAASSVVGGGTTSERIGGGSSTGPHGAGRAPPSPDSRTPGGEREPDVEGGVLRQNGDSVRGVRGTRLAERVKAPRMETTADARAAAREERKVDAQWRTEFSEPGHSASHPHFKQPQSASSQGQSASPQLQQGHEEEVAAVAEAEGSYSGEPRSVGGSGP